ncbi:hypothetical protein SAMN05444161_7072 [Rhizobiales bacterium GAS191]|nr:hypothetical protein SAMN05444161_7072 [Rhizobiales bacterium GAS191]
MNKLQPLEIDADDQQIYYEIILDGVCVGSLILDAGACGGGAPLSGTAQDGRLK